LQKITFEQTSRFFHDGDGKPVKGIYLCPLCLKNKIGMVGENLHFDEEFTLDHYPPKSVGGKETVLVCKVCNDGAGADFDYAAKEWMTMRGFNEGVKGVSVPATLSFFGTQGRYKGNLLVGDKRQIALDDFGAGYTSFKYLKDLSADALKIDGEFIRTMCAHPADIAIVEAIVALARNLGMRSVAEWVEDVDTLRALKEIGVDYVQGYLIAKPQESSAILAASSAASFRISAHGSPAPFVAGSLRRPNTRGSPSERHTDLFALHVQWMAF